MLSLFVTLQTLVSSAKDRLSREENGATAVEYGLLVGLIAVVIIGVVVLLGPQLASIFQGVSNELPEATNTPAAG